PKYLGCR
ncbi:hypothetical protein D030_0032B, partial [Vibrio parahaemolyticus AQ3810]